MWVYFQNFDFRPIISTADFKISDSIRSSLGYLRNAISSLSSGVQLSLVLNEPLLLNWLIQRSKADSVKSYSLTNSLRDSLADKV